MTGNSLCKVKPGHDQSGFTLLELLLALLILSLIMAVIAGALSLATRSWEAGDRLAVKNQRIRMLLNQISDEIRSIQPLMVEFELEEGDTPKNKGFIGSSDSVTFITSTKGLTKDPQLRGLRAVHYQLESDDGLVVYEETLNFKDFFEDPETGRRLVLNPEITYISFRYLYVPPKKKKDDLDEEEPEPQWLSSWDPAVIENNQIIEDDNGNELPYYIKVPRAVEISLRVQGKSSDQELPTLVLPVYSGRKIEAE